jgi:uncharacterized membrane protein
MSGTGAGEPGPADARLVGKSRLEALADGIFAIVMTLLVLDLMSPGWTTMQSAAEVNAALRHLWPKLLSYAISFVIAGLFWVAHHSLLHFVRHADRRYLWINMLFLLGVSFLPFSAALLGSHPDVRSAVMIYGANVLLVSLALTWNWSYASRHTLVTPGVPVAFSRAVGRRLIVGQLLYGGAMVVALASPEAAFLLYIVVTLTFVALQVVPGR